MCTIWHNFCSLNLISLFTCCRDGRIKVIGGDSIEGLLVSPKQSTLKNLEVCALAESLNT